MTLFVGIEDVEMSVAGPGVDAQMMQCPLCRTEVRVAGKTSGTEPLRQVALCRCCDAGRDNREREASSFLLGEYDLEGLKSEEIGDKCVYLHMYSLLIGWKRRGPFIGRALGEDGVPQ